MITQGTHNPIQHKLPGHAYDHTQHPFQRVQIPMGHGGPETETNIGRRKYVTLFVRRSVGLDRTSYVPSNPLPHHIVGNERRRVGSVDRHAVVRQPRQHGAPQVSVDQEEGVDELPGAGERGLGYLVRPQNLHSMQAPRIDCFTIHAHVGESVHVVQVCINGSRIAMDTMRLVRRFDKLWLSSSLASYRVASTLSSETPFSSSGTSQTRSSQQTHRARFIASCVEYKVLY